MYLMQGTAILHTWLSKKEVFEPNSLKGQKLGALGLSSLAIYMISHAPYVLKCFNMLAIQWKDCFSKMDSMTKSEEITGITPQW